MFEGKEDHLEPSTFHLLLESDMFIVAGRMMGHSFLHGGPSLCGLSPAIVHALCGGSAEGATISQQDRAELDIQQTIKLVSLCSTNIVCIKLKDANVIEIIFF